MELDERVPKERKPDALFSPGLPDAECADPASPLALRITACDRGDLVTLANDKPQRSVRLGRVQTLALPFLVGRLMKAPLVLERLAERLMKRSRIVGPERRDLDAGRPRGRARRTIEVDPHAVVVTRLAKAVPLEQRARSRVLRECADLQLA